MSVEKRRSSKRQAVEEKVLGKAKRFVPGIREEPEPDEEALRIAQAAEDTKVNAAIEEAGLGDGVIVPQKKRKPRHDKSLKKPKDPEAVAAAETEKGKAQLKSKKKKKKKKNTKIPEAPTPEVLDESEKKRAAEALEYLKTWNKNKSHWKFEKLKQIWLVKHALRENLIDKDNFETLLHYIGSIQGRARLAIQNDMLNIMGNYERKYNDNSDEEPTEEEEKNYERAKQIVQMLADE